MHSYMHFMDSVFSASTAKLAAREAVTLLVSSTFSDPLSVLLSIE